MIKLSGSIGRKVPVPGIAFSSQSCSAGMEVEIATEQTDAIQERLRQLYALLRDAVDEQLVADSVMPSGEPLVESAGNALPSPPPSLPAQTAPVVSQPAQRVSAAHVSLLSARGNGNSSNGNGNGPGGGNGDGHGQETRATRAQQRAIHAICKNLGLDAALFLFDYGVVSAADLSIKEASRVIDDLKFRQANDLTCG